MDQSGVKKPDALGRHWCRGPANVKVCGHKTLEELNGELTMYFNIVSVTLFLSGERAIDGHPEPHDCFLNINSHLYK